MGLQKVHYPGFYDGKLGLFRDQFHEVPLGKVLEVKLVLESWLMFKYHLIQTQER